MLTKITLALVACWFVAVHAADLDATCASNTDCTVANSECSMLFDGCTNGECKCETGYLASGTTKCLAQATYGQTCDEDTTITCIGGTSCPVGGGNCECAATDEYNVLLQICVTIGQKAISEECSAVADCFAGSTMAECVANTGTVTPLYCRCVTGYVTEANSCRIPYVGETCDSGVGCSKQDFSAFFTVFNQEDETCVSGTCTCPATADQLSATFFGGTNTFCQTKFTGTEKANGDTCTASNECSSNFCKQCPGDSTSTCISMTTTSSESTASRSVAVSGAALIMSGVTYLFL